MANRRKLTAQERRRIQAMKARIAKRKAAQTEDELLDEEETLDEDEQMIEEAKRKAYRRYKARKAAQERKARAKKRAQDIEIDLDDEDELEDVEDLEDVEEDGIEDMIEKAKRKAVRKAKVRLKKRAQENVSDDLKGPDGDSSNIEDAIDENHPSDDLTDPDDGDGGTEQTPPASVDEAEDKIVEAYRLIENQIAHNIVSADVRKASLARDYMKKYSKREMKFASSQLEKIGSVSKTAKQNVRVHRRGSALQKAKTASQAQSNIDDLCLFM